MIEVAYDAAAGGSRRSANRKRLTYRLSPEHHPLWRAGTANHFPIIYGTHIPFAHGMHRVEHFLRHFSLDRCQIVKQPGWDTHQIRNHRLHEFGKDPIRAIESLYEVNDTYKELGELNR